jgi:uncharacterized small protein (DUF1192 family)
VDEEDVKKKPAYQLGQDLSLLSEGELEQTIADLRAEIERLEAEMNSKSASRNAAEAFFKS